MGCVVPYICQLKLFAYLVDWEVQNHSYVFTFLLSLLGIFWSIRRILNVSAKKQTNLIFIANFATLAFQYSVFGFRELKIETPLIIDPKIFIFLNRASSLSMSSISLGYTPWVSRSKVVGSRKFLFRRFNFVSTNNFADFITTDF